MRKMGRFFADLYYLMKPYFVGEERASAWALLLSVVVLTFAQVGYGVVLSFARNVLYTALQEKHAHAFWSALVLYTPRPHGLPIPGFFPSAAVLILMGVIATYLQSLLQIRWRRWMTARLVEDWLDEHAHFRLMLTRNQQDHGTDNPDQRIDEDIGLFTDNSLNFTLGLLQNVVTVLSYAALLWVISAAVRPFGLQVPGLLLWVAITFSVVVTLISHLIGRPLAGLTFTQQRFSGNFRFSLVRVRDNSEGIALLSGEPEERQNLSARFGDIYRNYVQIIRRTAWLSTATGYFGYVSDEFPLVIAAPAYFLGRITFGTIAQLAQVFQQVQTAFLWFMNSYAGLAAYAAQIERLATFQRALTAARSMPEGIRTDAAGADAPIGAASLALARPDRHILLRAPSLRLEPGQSTAVMGASGAGKSTLFRTIAGIWPFGTGTLSLPDADRMFLPQRPYLPAGTLRRALCYPLAADAVAEDSITGIVRDVGLERYLDQLDVEAPWGQRMSPGEQQRLSIARALIVRPRWLFLDEATASLDEASETALYRLLAERLPQTTLVSITHRDSVAKMHDRVLRLEPGIEASTLVAA